MAEGSVDRSGDDRLAVAPPPPDNAERPVADVREAHDADTHAGLKRHPGDEDAKLDVALDETFPTSDPPSNTQPGKGKDPAPSSGYDPIDEERLRSN